MTIFQVARQVTAEDAARRLGLEERNKRFLCPFHDDHNPSMACYANTGLFYCFSCHAKGDATALWAKVKDLPMLEAARDLCATYELPIPEDARVKWIPPQQREAARQEKLRVRRIDEVAALPHAVWEAWQDFLASVLMEAMEANMRLMEVYPDPGGWRWRYALNRYANLSDEVERVRAIAPVKLAEEVAERCHQTHPAWDQPHPDGKLLEAILEEVLRKRNMTLSPEEAAWVRKTLRISG